MIRTRLLAAAVVAVLALGGCATTIGGTPQVAGASAGNGAAPEAGALSSTAGSPSAGVPFLPMELGGVPMVATEVTGAHTIVPGSRIFLRLNADGTMLGTAGCAELSDEYTLSGNVLSTALLSEPRYISEAMGCFDGRDAAQDSRTVALVKDQEIWFVRFLGSSPTWTFANGILTLTNGADTIAMTRAPGSLGAPGSAEALEGIGWRLGAAIAPGIFRPIGPKVSAWVRFDGNNLAFGSQCNRGGGNAEATDDTITFGALSITENSCEAAITGNTDGGISALVVGTTRYFLQDPLNNVVTITSPDGSGLQFVADPTAGADDADSSGAGSAGVTAPPTS